MKPFLSHCRFFFVAMILLAGSNLRAESSSISTVHLNSPTVIGGIPVAAGDIQVFLPAYVLQHGVLSAGATIQGLNFTTGTELLFADPGELETANLPNGQTQTIAGQPFHESSPLNFSYDQYWQKFQGSLVYHPNEVAGFPTVDLAKDVFENNVLANCERYIDPTAANTYGDWFCTYGVTLSEPISQTLSTETFTLPEGTAISFTKWGISSFTFPSDTLLLGFPVAGGTPVQVNRYTTGSPQSIWRLTLANDVTFQGIPISRTDVVELFGADSNGVPELASCTPMQTISLPADGQQIELAAFKQVQLNSDGSLAYGTITGPQEIQGILFPENSLLFFRGGNNGTLYSAGLQTGSSVIINGVSYFAEDGKTLFLDFDETGKVIQVRE